MSIARASSARPALTLAARVRACLDRLPPQTVSSSAPSGPLALGRVCFVAVTGDDADVGTVGRLVQDRMPHAAVLGAVTAGDRSGVTLTVVDPGPGARITPFYVGPDVRGRKQVGRLGAPDRTVGDWTRFESVSAPPAAATSLLLPVGLADAARDPVPPTLLLAADDNSELALIDLDRALPHAHKVGVVGRATPFVNGQAHTLFLGPDMYAGGVVGVAVRHSAHVRPPVLAYSARPLGGAYTVTRARGNLVIELDGGRNPAQCLLDLLAAQGGPKTQWADDAIYLGLCAPAAPSTVIAAWRVLSGDPKRGSLALETVRDVAVGSTVRFLRPGRPAELADAAGPHALRFVAVAEGAPAPDGVDSSDLGVLASTMVDGKSFTAVHRLPGTVASLASA